MTISELSLELGVSAVYLEDEIELLKKYDLLTVTGNGKVQTNLCIFTEAFDHEFYRAAEEQFTGRLGGILADVKQKLPEIRKLNFRGCAMEENRLMWALYYKLICEGCRHWKDFCHVDYPRVLYGDAKGVVYGVDYEEGESIYSSNAFAGYYGLSETTAASFADFGVLGEKNAFGSGHNWPRLPELVKQSRECGANAPLAYFTPEQVDRIYMDILSDEIAALGEFYRDLTDCAAEIMKNHAPKSVADEVDAVLRSTIFHRTVGLMGKLAMDTGTMKQPDDDLPAAVFLFETKCMDVGMKGDCCD
jgi:hypothetical protein